MAAAESRAPHSSDRIDLVNEDNAGGLISRDPKQITNPPGTDADEHLDELRSVDRKERHAGFTGSGP